MSDDNLRLGEGKKCVWSVQGVCNETRNTDNPLSVSLQIVSGNLDVFSSEECQILAIMP